MFMNFNLILCRISATAGMVCSTKGLVADYDGSRCALRFQPLLFLVFLVRRRRRITCFGIQRDVSARALLRSAIFAFRKDKFEEKKQLPDYSRLACYVEQRLREKVILRKAAWAGAQSR
jgi:hypothetical protein